MCELLFSQALLFLRSLSQGFSYVSRIREMGQSILQSRAFAFKAEVSAIIRGYRQHSTVVVNYMNAASAGHWGRSLRNAQLFGCVIG